MMPTNTVNETPKQHPVPELSVLMVAGRRRERAQRVLDALGAQTCRDKLEIVVADLAPDTAPALEPPDGIPYESLELAGDTSWGQARAEVLTRSSAPIVAYIEDHCYPSSGWAAAILTAHQEPWAAVGYAFTNPYPENYVSRSAMMFDYGIWIHPANRGASKLLAYNNVSYKRQPLLDLGSDLTASLSCDFHIHNAFQRQGLEMAVEPDALAAHENFAHLGGILSANHHYCRVLAAQRAEAGGWSWPLRLFYFVATPIGAPLISFGRLIRSMKGRRSLWGELVYTSPVVLLTAIWTACGESLGYVFGPGKSEKALSHWEIHAKRSLQG